MNRSALISLCLLLLLACRVPSVTAEPLLADPLPARNLHPLRWVFLQPLLESARVGGGGTWQTGVEMGYATVYSSSSNGDDKVTVDLESASAVLGARISVGASSEFGAEIPYRWMGGGVFDKPLVAYHTALNLPQGDRPNNTYRYEVKNGSNAYRPDAPAGGGLGDISLLAGHAFTQSRGPGWSTAARLALKLPTGNPSHGFGSGHADLGTGILVTYLAPWWTITFNGDLVYLGGTPDPALELGTRLMPSAGVAAGLAVFNWGTASCQVQYAASPYQTGLGSLDDDSALLAVGFQGRIRDRWRWSAGFTEDLAVGASPDFSVFLSVALDGR